MNSAGHDWVEALPGEMSGQQALLRRLLAQCDANDSIRWLVVACSVGRGAGDRLSDLDMGIGISDDALELSWRSLNEIGNLSSASVLHILRDARAKPPTSGTPGVLMAMGPGFCAELVLLRWH